MPWEECSAMEERPRVVARLIDSDLCRECGISRKTDYRIFDRRKEEVAAVFADRASPGRHREDVSPVP